MGIAFHFRPLLIALLFFAAIITSCNNSQEIKNPVKQYMVAYNVLVDESEDDYDVFIRDLSGKNPTNLTKDTSDVAWTYIAGKNKIYFVSDRDTTSRIYFLYEMNPDGSALRRISDIPLRDSWMDHRKNETEFIINPHPSIDSVFYIINKDGDLVEKVNTGMPYASDPCFSPSGEEIVFRGAMKRSKLEDGFVAELYKLKIGTPFKQRLTFYPKQDTTASKFAYRTGPPRWSMANNIISYQSFQEGKYILFGVTPDGQSQFKLLDVPENQGWHDWSDDGRWLAYESFDNDQTQFQIKLVEWESKAVKVLTDSLYRFQQAPVFVEIE